MKKAIFRYVEAELYDYIYLKKEIESMRENIIESGPILDGSESNIKKANLISDTTLAKTTRLLTNKRLRKMEETVVAIDRVICRLPDQKLKLVKLKYWDSRLTDRGIMEQLHVSPATYYRWKNGIVRAVAIEMGLVNVEEQVEKNMRVSGG